MDLSWNAISAGAMTAAMSVGSTVQSLGANAVSAAQALPSVAAGGAQAVASTAVSAVNSVPAALPSSIPGAVHAGAAGTAALATDLSTVEKPAKLLAAGAPKLPLLARVAGFLSKALPIVTIGASALAGARIVTDQGVDALVNTKEGRGAVLGAAGGVLLLVPTPVTQLAAAGVLGAVAVNHFGGMDKLNAAPKPEMVQRPAQA